MKLISILILIMTGFAYAQIRIVEVDPVNEIVTIKNFGGLPWISALIGYAEGLSIRVI